MGELIEVNFKNKLDRLQSIVKDIDEYLNKNIEVFTKIFNPKQNIVTDANLTVLITSLKYHRRLPQLKELYKLLQQIIIAYNLNEQSITFSDIKEFKKIKIVDDLLRELKVMCGAYTQPIRGNIK